MKKAKIYLGSPPSKDTNFTLLSRVKFDGIDWDIYEDVESSAKWYFYKLVSCKPVKNKANYSIVYSPEQKRLAGKDLIPLSKYRIGLLCEFIAKADFRDLQYFGSSFSESIAQMLENEG